MDFLKTTNVPLAAILNEHHARYPEARVGSIIGPVLEIVSHSDVVIQIFYAKTAAGAAGYSYLLPDGSFAKAAPAIGDMTTDIMAQGRLQEIRHRANIAIAHVPHSMTGSEMTECGDKWLQANTAHFTCMDQLYFEYVDNESAMADLLREQGFSVHEDQSATQSARALQAFEDARLRKEKRAQEAAAKKAAAKQRKKARRSPPPAPISEAVLVGGPSAAAQKAAAQKVAQQKATAAAEEAALLQAQAKKQQKRQKSPTDSAPPSAAAQHRLDQAKKAAKKAKKRK